jgi:uncharacterized cupin superfamily protein
MIRFNVLSAPVERDPEEPRGYGPGVARFGDVIGASAIGGTVYELGPGQAVCPYHYHHGEEEWLLVLSGSPALRHPEGEETLAAGDVVCFPGGPAGAHQVLNRGQAPARVLLLSAGGPPSVTVYPDSDKIGVWVGDGNPDNTLVRRDSRVGYWEGEG